jgi:hypothetical protein
MANVNFFNHMISKVFAFQLCYLCFHLLCNINFDYSLNQAGQISS